MDDYRVSTSWRDHPKRKKLERRLGRDGVLAIMDLWAFCANTPSRRSGDLSGMDDEDITLAANYPVDDASGNATACEAYANKCAAFVAVLSELRLIDGVSGAYRVHDFEENNPHVASVGTRSAAAKSNANIRWHKEGKHKSLSIVGCKLCEEEAMQNNAKNANECDIMPTHEVAYAPVRSLPSFPLLTHSSAREEETSNANALPADGTITASKFEEILSSPPYCWRPPTHSARQRIAACCPVPISIWDSALKITLGADKPSYGYLATVLESECKNAREGPPVHQRRGGKVGYHPGSPPEEFVDGRVELPPL
jgi:hypothetical protein